MGFPMLVRCHLYIESALCKFAVRPQWYQDNIKSSKTNPEERICVKRPGNHIEEFGGNSYLYYGLGQCMKKFQHIYYKPIYHYCTVISTGVLRSPVHPHRKTTGTMINSSPPSAAYMRQWIGSAFVQIIACNLFSAKSLSKPVLGDLSIGPLGTNFSEILIKMQNLNSRKCVKIPSAKWPPFCPVEMD